MKTQIAILTILLLSSTLVFGKKNAVVIKDTYYGVGVAQINSGSGHGVGYSFSGAAVKGRKSFEVGLIYSERESKISGGDIRYRIMLGNIFRIQEDSKVFTPYLQYNLLYQKGMSYAPDMIQLGGETYEIASEPGTVATMGHYLAYGNKIKLFDRAYIDTSIGLGVYQGSLDQENSPDTWGVHGDNNGLTYSFKVGVGYSFN